ncbi:MAG TPA: selenium cofactor biosynthesis protein YqeC [Geminicoccaceae bacterium]|nr:selenium cofactor biosynthesis protein YqeC [Geminicoccaceae bacterium]
MTPESAARLLDLLAARSGLVCAVGAGGKKSTLYRLAEAHLLAGTARIGLTCTVTMSPPPRTLPGGRLVASPEALAAEVPALAPRHRLLAYAQPSSKPGRIGGVGGEQIARLHADGGFAVTLVKADGARMRWLKAPREDEPVLPAGVASLLPVVSAKALGQPLDQASAHRVERVAAVTGAAIGEPLRPAHLARLLASAEGSLQRVGAAVAVPIINMVDDEERLAGACEVARQALAATDRFDRVVLTSMIAADPVVDVIVR